MKKTGLDRIWFDVWSTVCGELAVVGWSQRGKLSLDKL